MSKQSHTLTPHLWFDKEAVAAAEFYCKLFSGSKITNVDQLHNTPSGDCDLVSFELSGQPFLAISAGPFFKFNPSLSFIAGCETAEQLNRLWDKFSEGGQVLMEIGTYPFSERYGWVQDRFGLSWQLILTKPEGDERPVIIPALLFVGQNYGKAEEAIRFYLSVFKDSRQGALVRYGAGETLNKEGTVMFADFMIGNCWIAAMDSAFPHEFAFNEAVSFVLYCDTQKEIDYYWESLSAVPEAEQCGWLKDKYGVSWQIVPAVMNEMMRNGSKEQIAQLTEAFLKMKKFDIEKLTQVYAGGKQPGLSSKAVI